jgi:hypothetical protein
MTKKYDVVAAFDGHGLAAFAHPAVYHEREE